MQFAGRFPRVGSGNFGTPTIVANTGIEDVSRALEGLYDEDADWDSLLNEFHFARVAESERFEEFNRKCRDLSDGKVPEDSIAAKLNPKNLNFRFNTVVYRNAKEFNPHGLRNGLEKNHRLLRAWQIDESNAAFYVTRLVEKGIGLVDYVLWSDEGKPLAVVEAKRTRKDARVGQTQGKLYADSLEQMTGLRPIIFYTNGHEHWIWDDERFPPRRVQGFLKQDELKLMIERRKTAEDLSKASIDKNIAGRYYQEQAIRHITEAMMLSQRKALVVMATGSGKTRTVIALCDLLQRCNWIKRVLFLADRVALVNQAVNAFKTHLPHSNPVNLVNLVTEKEKSTSRVYVSTYPTMMGLIDDSAGGLKRFGAGHFDLIIIDEAHRSVYQKYKAIFQYFDSYLIGLTATPRDEVDRDTYSLFELNRGVPTYAYELEQAVADGYLAPPSSSPCRSEYLARG